METVCDERQKEISLFRSKDDVALELGEGDEGLTANPQLSSLISANVQPGPGTECSVPAGVRPPSRSLSTR
jgi:hypothetical protein